MGHHLSHSLLIDWIFEFDFFIFNVKKSYKLKKNKMINEFQISNKFKFINYKNTFINNKLLSTWFELFKYNLHRLEIKQEDKQ